MTKNHFKKLSGKHKCSSLCTLQASATGLPNWMSEVSATVGYIMASSNVPLVEFMYLAFTCMPGESSRRQLRSLMVYLCYVCQALINSLVC